MIVEIKTQRDKIHLKLLSKISGSKEIIFEKIWDHSFWVKWSGMNKVLSFNRNKDPMTFFILFVFPQLNPSGTMHLMFHHIEELVRRLKSESHYIWLKIVYSPPFWIPIQSKITVGISLEVQIICICICIVMKFAFSFIHQRYLHIVMTALTFEMSNIPLKHWVIGIKLSFLNFTFIRTVIHHPKILIDVLAPD